MCVCARACGSLRPERQFSLTPAPLPPTRLLRKAWPCCSRTLSALRTCWSGGEPLPACCRSLVHACWACRGLGLLVWGVSRFRVCCCFPSRLLLVLACCCAAAAAAGTPACLPACCVVPAQVLPAPSPPTYPPPPPPSPPCTAAGASPSSWPLSLPSSATTCAPACPSPRQAPGCRRPALPRLRLLAAPPALDCLPSSSTSEWPC